ncbi:fucolectin-1-like [Pseudoliparis swirei]|uniref:fucolectin-1-like n=1 Tax=Pseudoliparis swirei TaxID=2059687 RepID=UPI0024BE0A3B|nr:fucolectin-1-like [Pseudoliparis swirei]
MISCSHTGKTETTWWRLILPAMYRITSVSITNRNDVPERINNAMILIGNCPMNNGNNNPICAVIPSIPSGSTKTFNCGGMIGRFVNVYLNSEYLTICELEVYGELVTPSPSFGAVVMGRNVVVVEKKLSWSDAVLYCRDFYWDLLSIRSEEEQVEVGEVLSTTSFPLTQHVCNT